MQTGEFLQNALNIIYCCHVVTITEKINSNNLGFPDNGTKGKEKQRQRPEELANELQS
jgi:hypothetical protein